MLEVTVFTSGAVLLVLEIVASRVLAPFFGNSVYVWGSLIGVFLAGLTLGYFVGGRVADRWPSPVLFSALVFLAGALTFPIPYVARPLLGALVLAGFGPRAGSLLAAALLFLLPSVVMGTVSPFAVRLRARSVLTVGNVAGVLYALSTLGSILGTLLAAFVLINAFGVRAIIHGLGIILMLLAVAGLLTARRAVAAAATGGLAVALVAGGVAAGPVHAPDGVVFQRDTVYHQITVSDEGRVRYLKLDNYWQSGLDLDDPHRTVFAYSDYMHAPLLLVPRPERVALIGLGGGTVPRRFVEDYPQVQVDVAELDPEVVAAAYRYFDLPRTPRLRVIAQDGRLFLFTTPTRYDLILLDAYLIDTIPFHLATREFFELVAARLRPGGVAASNVIGALDGPDSRLFRAIYRTFRTVFPTVYVFPVGWHAYGSAASVRNIIIVGTHGAPLDAAALRARGAALAGTVVRVPGFPDVVASLYPHPVRTEDVPLLTDDHAPVDALIPRR
ncbi:MAG: fused MFS/spermidine synthase [Armatimonadota bacterium]|nr:fused MFS/spermidine synthase [Armatimonadota bacterium]MDR7478652.1 fused MFS/spermidine synthase [Armatimonadota bacterium]MDR7488047.1 fused MFS/spermidine synthase [Armatimonadota bacterium]MDR7489848.1 fused MFS/spermidine synthase [Armatimonadota bacterium]MDR7500847.1 fused MFS/spermidine synthase [Armatimonadota bacterium]